MGTFLWDTGTSRANSRNKNRCVTGRNKLLIFHVLQQQIWMLVYFDIVLSRMF